MGRKAVLKDLVDIVMMLKQDEEDKEKPEEEYKVEIPEGLRRKVQAILREKHKVKALAPDTGKWGGPTALSSNGHGRGSTGKSTIQNAEEDELQKESGEGETATVKRSGTYYGGGERGAAPIPGETSIKPSPLFPTAGTEQYAPTLDHNVHRAATKERIKRNRRLERHEQIPQGEVCIDCGGELPKKQDEELKSFPPNI